MNVVAEHAQQLTAIAFTAFAGVILIIVGIRGLIRSRRSGTTYAAAQDRRTPNQESRS